MTKERAMPNAQELLTAMLRIRLFEEKIVALYPEQQMRTPVHLCLGQEAVPAGVCLSLRADDVVCSTHRNHGHYLAKGGDPAALAAELYGRSTGCARGKGGSMHSVDPEAGIYASTSIVGGSLPIAVGAALAFSLRREPKVGVAFLGDGATEEGVFHESCNLAALRRLPLLIVVEDNGFATLSPKKQRQGYPGAAALARVYGLECFEVDGNDAPAVAAVAGPAIAAARAGRPALIQASTYRWLAHVGPVEDTGLGHRTAALLKAWKERCPIRALVAGLKMTEADLRAVSAPLEAEVEAAFDRARTAPEPSAEELLKNVF